MAWFWAVDAGAVAGYEAAVVAGVGDAEFFARGCYERVGGTPLRWGGSGSLGLGLDGVVALDAYRAVFGSGGCRHPISRRRLVENRRRAFLVNVAVNKTVAVLDVVGRTDDLHAILGAETAATMSWLDAWFRERGGCRGKARVRTPTTGLVWSVTRRATSRAGDPSPSDHVLVANVVEMLDTRGGYKSLDSAALRDHVEAATMVGRLASAARAIELGYVIEPVAGRSGRRRAWRIGGVPRRVCEQFSKRSQQIDKRLADVGYRSHRARRIAAHATVGPHSEVGPAELRAGWRAELADIGLPSDVVSARVDEACRHRPRPRALRDLTDDEIDWLADDLVGPGGVLARRKVFTRSALIAELAPRLYGYRPKCLDRAVAGILGSDRVALLEPTPAATEPAYRSVDRRWR